MTNVSKRHLKREVLELISDQLLVYVSRARTKEGAVSFIEELFTDAERLMFAKRVAIVLMLEQGTRFEDIEALLKVSSTTVSRIWKQKQEGRYVSLVRYCRNRRVVPGQQSLLDLMELLLQAGMPLRAKGRWKRLP